MCLLSLVLVTSLNEVGWHKGPTSFHVIFKVLKGLFCKVLFSGSGGETALNMFFERDFN